MMSELGGEFEFEVMGGIGMGMGMDWKRWEVDWWFNGSSFLFFLFIVVLLFVFVYRVYVGF